MNFFEGISFTRFLSQFFSSTNHDKIMHLTIFVDDSANDNDNAELKNKYVNAALDHNSKIFKDPHFYDAGFDLYLPKNDNASEVNIFGDGTRFFGNDGNFSCTTINKVNFKVKCCARMFTKNGVNIDNNIIDDNSNNNNNNHFFYTPFYTYARSSMSKTPLRLANNQGIIDAGYRGPLIGMFDCIYSDRDGNKESDFYLEAYSRMLQVCAPGLVPIYVKIVDTVEELGPNTLRGEGGFGSTGI
jgi:dUTP pyrophosphatase